jgi:hypothetical protein
VVSRVTFFATLSGLTIAAVRAFSDVEIARMIVPGQSNSHAAWNDIPDLL